MDLLVIKEDGRAIIFDSESRESCGNTQGVWGIEGRILTSIVIFLVVHVVKCSFAIENWLPVRLEEAL